LGREGDGVKAGAREGDGRGCDERMFVESVVLCPYFGLVSESQQLE